MVASMEKTREGTTGEVLGKNSQVARLTRYQCFRIFFVDQLTLVITGVVAGNVLSVLIQGNYGGNSALAGVLVGICYLAGTSLALWKLLKVSVMEALFIER